MLRTKTAFVATLLLGVALGLPVLAGDDPVRATPAANPDKTAGVNVTSPDLDAAPLAPADLARAEARVDTSAPGGEGRGQVAPPVEVKVEVKIFLDGMNREHEALKKKYDELQELETRNKAEYDRRVRELETELAGEKVGRIERDVRDMARDGAGRGSQNDRGGMTGAVESDVVGGMDATVQPPAGGPTGGPTGGPAGGPAAGTVTENDPAASTVEGPAAAGTSDNSVGPDGRSPDAEASLPPADAPGAGLPEAQPDAEPTWWQKLLKKVAEGVGQALGKWLRNELGKLRDKAAAYANDASANNPEWKNWIARTVSRGIDDVLAGKYNAAILGLVDKVRGGNSTSDAALPAPPAMPEPGAATGAATPAPLLDPIPPSPRADRVGNQPVVNIPLG